MRKCLAFAALAILGAATPGCGGDSSPTLSPEPEHRASTRRVALAGISLALPAGWDGHSYARAPADKVGSTQRVIQASSEKLPQKRAEDDLARLAATSLSHDGILVIIWDHEGEPINSDDYTASTRPLRLKEEDFREDAFEGMVSGHAGLMRDVRIKGRFLKLFVEAGREVPMQPQLAQVNSLLASLAVDPSQA